MDVFLLCVSPRQYALKYVLHPLKLCYKTYFLGFTFLSIGMIFNSKILQNIMCCFTLWQLWILIVISSLITVNIEKLKLNLKAQYCMPELNPHLHHAPLAKFST